MFCIAVADSLAQDSSVSLPSSTLSRADFLGEENGITDILDPHRRSETKSRLCGNYLEPKAVF